jgi:hypothetical protein
MYVEDKLETQKDRKNVDLFKTKINRIAIQDEIYNTEDKVIKIFWNWKRYFPVALRKRNFLPSRDTSDIYS